MNHEKYEKALEERVRTLEAALVEARQVLETAKQYFPKSIRNADRYSLLNVLANAVGPAIERIKKENDHE